MRGCASAGTANATVDRNRKGWVRIECPPYVVRSDSRDSGKRITDLGERDSTRLTGEGAEEGFDVGVGGDGAVAVEVGAVAALAAVAGEAGEEGFDVGVGGARAVVVEVGVAAGEVDGEGLFLGSQAGGVVAGADEDAAVGGHAVDAMERPPGEVHAALGQVDARLHDRGAAVPDNGLPVRVVGCARREGARGVEACE